MGLFEKKIRHLIYYNELIGIDEIARRYFVMNSFDGILAMLGILVASYFAGIMESKIIIVTGFGAAVAMGISGVWGAYLTEKAERTREYKEIREEIKDEEKRKHIRRATKIAPYIVAIIDGLSPFLAIFIVITPFLLGLEPHIAFYSSLVITVFFLLFIGAFLGRISEENMIVSGLKMVLVGAFCFLVIMALGL